MAFDEQTQIYVIVGVSGGLMLLLTVLVIVLFYKVSSLANELRANQKFQPQPRQAQAPVQAQEPMQGYARQSQSQVRSRENDELVRRGYSIYAPSTASQAQQQRHEDPRRQSRRGDGPAPPPKKGGSGFGFGGLGSKVVQSEAFGQVAAGQYDAGGAMDMAGGFVENEHLAGALESNLFQSAVNSGIQYGANRAITNQQTRNQDSFMNGAGYY